jgi:hypothetical protein
MFSQEKVTIALADDDNIFKKIEVNIERVQSI